MREGRPISRNDELADAVLLPCCRRCDRDHSKRYLGVRTLTWSREERLHAPTGRSGVVEIGRVVAICCLRCVGSVRSLYRRTLSRVTTWISPPVENLKRLSSLSRIG